MNFIYTLADLESKQTTNTEIKTAILSYLVGTTKQQQEHNINHTQVEWKYETDCTLSQSTTTISGSLLITKVSMSQERINTLLDKYSSSIPLSSLVRTDGSTIYNYLLSRMEQDTKY